LGAGSQAAVGLLHLQVGFCRLAAGTQAVADWLQILGLQLVWLQVPGELPD